jgi:cephalosporin hydroxylase
MAVAGAVCDKRKGLQLEFYTIGGNEVNDFTQFDNQKLENIANMNENTGVLNAAKDFMQRTTEYQYSYNYTWMGLPVIQYPQDLLAMQEVIMQVKPDLIIETGIARGGSVVFYASMLELLGDSNGLNREVVAIDIDLRTHNRDALEKHPMWKRITVLNGSSTDADIVTRVRDIASRHKTVLVTLDSLHTHKHVYDELNAYAALVTKGSYIVVFDTNIEFIAETRDRPWSIGNNPYTAVQQWLNENDSFIYDAQYDRKSLITNNPGGWLLRVKP